MNDLLIKSLIDFGFSTKEAKVYIALLELESALVSNIAKQAGINRSSTYTVLKALEEKGMVVVTERQKIKIYSASPPEVLLNSANLFAERKEKIKRDIEKVLPQLKSLHKATKYKPIVKIFEGENGAKEVYRSLLTSQARELRTFINPLNIFKYITGFEEIDKERGAKGIKMFAIHPANKEILNLYKKIKPYKPYESALIPEEQFNFSSDIGIYDDKVSFISPKDHFGVTIENKEIADMLENTFNLAWEEANRLNEKLRRRVK